MTDHDEAQSGGSGRDSLGGCECQIDVSIWFALQLLVASKLS